MKTEGDDPLIATSYIERSRPSESRTPEVMQCARYVVMHQRGARKGIFWITPDAPQAAIFRELGREQQVVCLRAPTQAIDKPPLSLKDLALHYADSIDAFSRDDAIVLVGYCIAGVVARETAVQIRLRGRQVRSLIMIDPPDPAKSRLRLTRDPLTYRIAQQARRWKFHLTGVLSSGPNGAVEYVRGSVRGVLARLNYRRSKSAYAIAGRRGEVLPDGFGDSYHMAVAAFLNSTPDPYVGSACVIRPTDVPARVFEYSNLRWRGLITGGIDFVNVPGNSNTMWQEPAMKVLSAAIRDRIG